MTTRSRTFLVVGLLTGIIGGIWAWAHSRDFRGASGGDGIAQPLWLLRSRVAEAESYLGALDREALLRAFLIADSAGYGGRVVAAPQFERRRAGGLPPLTVLRGHALTRARSVDPTAAAPFGHDLASALVGGREEAIAMEASLYLDEVLGAGAAIVVESPMAWPEDRDGDLLDLDDSRLRRVIRWIDPRRDARGPLARAAARPGSLAESFAATAAIGGVALAHGDTIERLGSVQWRSRLPRDLSDSVFQVSGRVADWASAEAIYTTAPRRTLDSLRDVDALTASVLRERLLPMATLRLATRRMGGERLPAAERTPGAARELRPVAAAAARANVDPPRPRRPATSTLVSASDTVDFRLRIRRESAVLLAGDAPIAGDSTAAWAVRLDTVLVVNASGLRSGDLRSGLGVYGPSRWVTAGAPAVDSLSRAYTRAIVLVGPGAGADPDLATLVNTRARLTDTTAAVVVGAPEAAEAYATAPTLLYQPSADIVDWRRLYAGVFGGRPFSAKPPAALPAYSVDRGARAPRSRLAPVDPYTAGVDVVQLTDIDVAMREAIKAGAFPGGQVSVVYGDQLVYDKAFGTLAPGERATQTTDLYDLASLTKVASTTLAVMRLYERGDIALDAPLHRYLDGLPAATGRLRLRQLLLHQSGLPPSLPIYRELKRTRKSYHRVNCRTKYCPEASRKFSVPVAKRVYYSAEARNAFYAAAKREQPKGRHRYSDLNFFLLQQVVERVTGQPLDAYVHEEFYAPLGLALTYRPLERYGRRATLLRTAPTEYDHKWRRQRLRGYVHDEAAALQGGVGGHAGVFGSARDVAVLFAMLGNGGSYGGVRYFAPETIATFTETGPGGKRALGFAKAPRPDETPDGERPVFGHTGFTGTSVWTDAEAGITVAFTSNRIYRGRANWRLQKLKVRERVSRIVYDALAIDPRDGGRAVAKTETPAL